MGNTECIGVLAGQPCGGGCVECRDRGMLAKIDFLEAEVKRLKERRFKWDSMVAFVDASPQAAKMIDLWNAAREEA